MQSHQKTSEGLQGLTPVIEVCGVEGEEEVKGDCPLWGPSVTDHSVWHTVLQAHILWSDSQPVYNPGQEKVGVGSTCIAVSFPPSRVGRMGMETLEKSKNTLTELICYTGCV